MRQYRRAPRRRSTAAAAAALVAILIGAAACPGAAAPADTPAGVLLSAAAAGHYSLHLSADRRQWIAVFADSAELTLKLARGPLTAGQAAVDSVTALDRVDVPPGINPHFGRHAYLQHGGTEHLFYSDQELADARVTKWIYRDPAGAAPWMVDLLPEAILPLAALPALPARAAAAEEEPPFTLYGLAAAPPAEGGEERAGAELLAYDVLPEAVTGRRVVTTLAAPAAAPGAAAGRLISGYGCAGRNGFAVAAGAGTGVLLVEAGQAPQPLSLPPAADPAGGPAALGCGARGMLLAYTRDDPRATRTSAGPALQAREIVAVAVDAPGAPAAPAAEIKVTLARDVGLLAVFPEPPLAAGEPPALSVLFSELALNDAGEPEHRLALVTPDSRGGYRKQILVRGAPPLRDLRALRAGGALVVAFRRGRELRLLNTPLPSHAASEPQSGGSWRLQEPRPARPAALR